MVSTLSSSILTSFSCYNDNKKGFLPNQHVAMISEESCDTKAWSNDVENSAFHHKNKIVFYNIFKWETVF